MIFVTNSYSFIPVLDADAQVYINAVESADGQSLENEVKVAINNFVIGCKFDGIWGAIKASCILSVARTLSGALVPLVGTAPTNFNFVSGDYDRVTGLKGDGSTKRLNSNRNNNADPQNSKHISVFVTETYSVANSIYLGGTSGSGSSILFIRNATQVDHRLNSSSASTLSTNYTGLIATKRINSTQIEARGNNTSATVSNSSNTPRNEVLQVFSNSGGSNISAGRISFYSIGESLDLVALDTRVSNLMTDLSAAIP
jgi:hypothetical protein